MKVDNETFLRALDEEAVGVRRDQRGCPPVALAARLLAGDATEAERLAFAEHLLACPDCAEESRLARPLEDLAKRAGSGGEAREGQTVGRPGIRSAPWVRWAAAAAAAVALGLSVTWIASRRQPEAAAERGAAALTAAVVPPDGSTLAEPPAALAWTPVEAAESYRVVLFDAESTPIWEAPLLREARAPLPDAVRDRLRRGGDFYWRVETRKKAERLASELHRFSLPAGAKSGG